MWTAAPFATYRITGIPAFSAKHPVWLAPYEPSLMNARQTSPSRQDHLGITPESHGTSPLIRFGGRFHYAEDERVNAVHGPG